MEHIELKDTELRSTDKRCPVCNSLLNELIPKIITDFKKYFLCINCNFLGSVEVDQVETALFGLKQANFQLVDFQISQISGVVPFKVTFTSNCFNMQEQDWRWDFGDNSSGTGEEVTHTYEIPGQYTVTLDVFEPRIGRLIGVKENAINAVQHIPLDPNFIVENNTGYGQLQAKFTSLSLGTDIISYTWDFGDSTSPSYIRDPYHLYVSEGIYSVSLTIKNLRGEIKTKTIENFITVNPKYPTSEFTAKPLEAYVGSKVYFSYISDANVDNYSWDFGDGNIVEDQKFPVHQYDSTGLYDITLTSSNILGEKILTKTGYIEVLEYIGPPVADFDIEHKTHISILPQVLQFYDYSYGCDIESWYWEIDDGQISSEQNPEFSFRKYGVYNISLTVTDYKNNSHKLIKTIELDIGKPIADFEFEIDHINHEVHFTNTSHGEYLSYYWYFSDGNDSLNKDPKHTYIMKGIYNVVLTVSNVKGESVVEKLVEIKY